MSNAALMRMALALLPEIQVGVENFIAWINALRASASQANDWTAGQEMAWREALLDANVKPEELPDLPKP